MSDHCFIISIIHKAEATFDVACKVDDKPWSKPTEIQLALSDVNSIDANALSGVFSEEVKYHWRNLCGEKGGHIKFFLYLDEREPLLHNLPWEQLIDPLSSEGTKIANQERISFARTPFQEPQSFAPKPNGTLLKALAIIVRPENLTSEGYDDIDADKYKTIITDYLQESTITYLISQKNHPITLDVLRDKLFSDDYDIVYIVCHGQLSPEGEAVLIFQNEAGKVRRVNGTDLTQEIEAKAKLPALMFLISCQSGGADRAHQHPHRSLGYRLSKIGVDAVVAYHGTLYDETAQSFAQGFFEEFQRSRWVDFAVTKGRRKIKTTDPHQGQFLYFSRVRDRLVLGTPAPTAKNSVIKEPRDQRRSLNQSYVSRPELENEIIVKLKGLIENDIFYGGGIVYLHGPAGNGKTTLAQSICKSLEIEEFFEVIKLDATPPGLTGKPWLWFIDNAQENDIANYDRYLSESTGCCLITTRDQALYKKSEASHINILVVNMENEKDAAVELLCRPSGERLRKRRYRNDQEKLCKQLNYSPLLIKLVSHKIFQRIKMGRSLDRVVSDIIEEYKSYRFESLGDDRKIDELRKTIIRGSIDRLTSEESSLLTKLRIFEEAEVPIATVARLWDMEEYETTRLIEWTFARVSLVEYLAETKSIRLHAIIRDYLLGDSPLRPADHEQLIDAEGDNPTIYNPYMWRYFPMHLEQAQRLEMLRHRLLDPTWLRLWVRSSGVDAVIDTCKLFNNDPAITLLRRSLELATLTLRRDRSQIDLQLLGRLLSSQNHDIRALIAQFTHQIPLQWNRSGLIKAEGQFEMIISKSSGKLKAFASIESSGKSLQILGFNNNEALATIDVTSLRDQAFTSTALDYSLPETAIGASIVQNPKDEAYLAVSVPIKGICKTQIQAIDLKKGALLPSSCVIEGVCKQVSADSVGLYRQQQGSQTCRLRRQTFQGDELTSDPVQDFCGKPTILTSSRSGRWVVCGFYDNRLEVWDMSKSHILKPCFIEFFQEEITALAVSEKIGQAVLVVATQSLHIFIIKRDYSVKAHIIHDGHTNVTALALVKLSPIIIRGMSDGLIACENYTKNDHLTVNNQLTVVDTIQLPSQITDLATSDDGFVVIAACSGNTNLHVWHRGENQIAYSLPNTDVIDRVGLTADGKTAFCLSGGQLWVWNLSQDPPPNLVDAHKAPVRSIIIDEARRYAHTRADDETVYTWDLANGQRRNLPESEVLPFDSLDASDGPIEVNGREVTIWHTGVAEDQQFTLTLDSEVTASAVTADGRVFVIGDRSGQVHILALRD